MFIGREEELEELNRRYSAGSFEFIPIYGRKRVGKTALIDEFIKDKEHIKLTAVNGSLTTNMRLLASLVFNTGKAPPMNFEDVLEAMHQRFAGERYVFVIDEYPNLVRSDPSVSGILNNFIESHLDDKVFMILSGSSLGIMKDQVIGRKSPLYGRRTGQILLKPFRFDQIDPFLPNFTTEERLTVYGLVGGIPWYLGFFNNRKTLKENIIDNLIDPFAVLSNESELLFSEEFETPRFYYGIVSAIAKGHTRVKEIATESGLDTARVSVLLKNLVQLEIVEKIFPIDDPGTKRTHYGVKDPYLRTYFRLIYPRFVDVGRPFFEEAYNEISKAIPQYMGHVFEDVCSEFVSRSYPEVGTWWGTDPIGHTVEEIDLAAVGHGTLFLAECKYRSEPVGKDVLETLKRRSFLVKNALPRKFAIFSRSGFTEEIKGIAGREGVSLYSLKDITIQQ